MLNLYSYDPDAIKSIKDIHTQGKDDYISLFDCRENISVLKAAEIADNYKTHVGFRDILVRLGNLNDEAKYKTIREYNDILFDLVGDKKSGGLVKFIMGGIGFFATFYRFFSHLLTSAGLLKDLIDETGEKRNMMSIKN